MKKTKLLALLLALSLTLCLFAGCAAKTETPAAETPAAAEEPAAETPAAETPAAESAQSAPVSVDSPADAAPVAVGNEIAPASEQSVFIDYPIGDGSQTVEFWVSYNSTSMLPSLYDLPILPQIQEATGVAVKFIEVSSSASTEQYQLMVASGDWPDLSQVGTFYTGGSDQAYVDDVIMDLTPLLDDNAPDFMRIVSGLNATSKAGLLTTTDSGDKIYLGVSSINDVRWADSGLFCRQDWLDELGYTTADMETIDGFTQVLEAVYDKYAPSWTYYMNQAGGLNNCVAFDCGFPSLSDSGMTGVSQYLDDDGQVQSSWVSDGYRAYVEWFHDMYEKQIMNNEFYATSMNPDEQTSKEATGEMFIWGTVADRCTDVFNYLDDANQGMELAPLGMIYADDSHTNDWGSEQSTVGSCNMSIYSDCDQPELVLQYLNYFFTDDGILASNYGTEGVSFNYDDNGDPQFTEAVTNNPDFSSPQSAMQYYTPDYIPYYNYSGKMHVTYSPLALEAVELFTAASEYTSTKRTYPGTVTIDTNTTSTINNLAVDVCSYGMEQVLKFVTGGAELTDESWDAYVQGMYALKLQDILDLYQGCYDAYLAEQA